MTILGGNTADDATVRLETQKVAVGEGTISLQLTFAPNYKINPLIESELTLHSDTGESTSAVLSEATASVPVMFVAGGGQYQAEITLYYCREGEEALCFIETVNWIVPYEASEDNTLTEIVLERMIVAPDV